MIKYDNSITIFAPEGLLPSERTYKQLSIIAKDNRIKHPVIGLVDIHDKNKNDFPTGIVVVSQHYIFPQLMVSGPNCGMRMMVLPFKQSELSENDIDRLFLTFSDAINISPFFGKELTEQEIMDIMMTGSEWINRKYQGIQEDPDSIECWGNAFQGMEVDEDMIRNVVPQSMVHISRRRMGILGKGNHFLELQVIEEIYDKEKADNFGISKDNLCLFMHSGSGSLGAMLSHLYSPRTFNSREIKMHALVNYEWLRAMFHPQRRNYMMNMFKYRLSHTDSLFGLEEGSEQANLYLAAIMASSNFGYANRSFISQQIKDVIHKQLHIRQDQIKTIYDLSHMSIQKQEHGGEYLWIHRTGSVYAPCGRPVFLSGSMGDCTYICTSLEENSQTYYSASHGAGRLPKDKIEKRSADRDELINYLKDKRVTLYKGHSKKIIKQDPRCFKDINKALEYLDEQKLIKKIAKLRPVAVLKG